MWFEFLIQAMVFLAFLLLTQYDSPVYEFARNMLIQLGYPVDEINFYFLYQAEAEGNVQNAALLETFLATWCLPLLPRYLIAPFQKTQAGMDSWVRMTNFAWLPFTTSDGMRVLAFTAVWVGIFPGTSIMSEPDTQLEVCSPHVCAPRSSPHPLLHGQWPFTTRLPSSSLAPTCLAASSLGRPRSPCCA